MSDDDLSGAAPVDMDTPVGQLRLQIGDATATNISLGTGTYSSFGDAQLGQFVSVANQNVLMAASFAWMALAGAYTDQAAKITRTDLALDLTARATNARANAQWFAQIALQENTMEADQVFTVNYPYRTRDSAIPPELAAYPFEPEGWDIL